MLPTQMSETEETIQNQSLKDDELALIDLKAILEWLATPAARHPEDELAPLHAHLTALRETATAAHQRHKVLDLLYTRAHGTVQRLIPDLTGVSLPLSRKTRQTVRGMQDVLLMVAEDYLNTFGDLDAHLIKGLRRPPELTLWRALDALSSHLLISDYSASPAAPGVWSLMHRAYRMANEAGVTEQPARGAGSSPREVYQRALLLASAQPASFTSREIDVVVDYILRFGSRINLIAATEGMTDAGIFHIDPERDLPPVAAARRPPPAGAMCLNCERIAQLAEEQVTALDAGAAPRDIDLPDDFIAPSVQGILRRLALYWGHSGKRRFTRRRQNYRAVLCIGLQALWQLFWSTIPVYILAVLVLGAARVWLFPHADGAIDNTLLWVIAMAVAGCLFVIPTAAEIPIVQTMMLAGMGTAPALALLITLPAISLPSLIMLRKSFPAKALWLTAGLVALSGVMVGSIALL